MPRRHVPANYWVDAYYSSFFHRLDRDSLRRSYRRQTETTNNLRSGKSDSDRDSFACCYLADLPLRYRRHAPRARFGRDDPHRGGRFPEGLLGAQLSCGSDDDAGSDKGTERLSDQPFSAQGSYRDKGLVPRVLLATGRAVAAVDPLGGEERRCRGDLIPFGPGCRNGPGA